MTAALARELQHLANHVKANPDAQTRRLNRPAGEFQREQQPRPEGYARWVATCSLCGSESVRQVCERCSGHFERGGTL